jgi:hypothetical protein
MSGDEKKEEEQQAGMTSEWRPSAVYRVRTPRVDDVRYLVESCCRLDWTRW